MKRSPRKCYEKDIKVNIVRAKQNMNSCENDLRHSYNKLMQHVNSVGVLKLALQYTQTSQGCTFIKQDKCISNNMSSFS